MIWFGKALASLMLAAGLAGCVDVGVDVTLLSGTEARVTQTQKMTADFYTLIKEADSSEKPQALSGQFCTAGKLSEQRDGSATCLLQMEGAFADLAAEDKTGQAVSFTQAGPGLVRITLATAGLTDEIRQDQDSEAAALLDGLFAGRSLMLRFTGKAVTETNMDLGKDGKSAEKRIPLLDLIHGEADLPDQLYAVVRAP